MNALVPYELVDELHDFLQCCQHDSWRCTYAKPDGTLIYSCVCDKDRLVDELQKLLAGEA